ncbi:hypothetical protein VCHA43P273_350003 [Vibrio chagasii]|nr:hypothetical protein VCHA43P273_350003 [Vibrio chagasii]
MAKEIARVEGRIDEFLKLLVSHSLRGVTNSEVKTLLAVINNPSCVSLY